MQATNNPIPEPGTTAGSHLKEERDSLKSKTGEGRDQAKQKAHQAYDELRQGTQKIARDSGNYLKNIAAEQQHCLVEKLEEYRDALKAASDQLESDDDTMASKNIRKATSGLQCVTDYLRESEPNDLLSDASEIARKRPEIVFGGLFLVGLGIARVMKSSARERQQDQPSPDRRSSGEGDPNPYAAWKTGSPSTSPPAATPVTSATPVAG